MGQRSFARDVATHIHRIIESLLSPVQVPSSHILVGRWTAAVSFHAKSLFGRGHHLRQVFHVEVQMEAGQLANQVLAGMALQQVQNALQRAFKIRARGVNGQAQPHTLMKRRGH